jgi:putative PEP-CTERM system TPR-repeat lipoprotein
MFCFKEGIILSRRILLVVLVLITLTSCRSKTKEELFAEGVNQIKNGNPGAAIVMLKNALEKDQNYLEARYQLALAYKESGKFEQAEREFQKVLRQNPNYPGLKLLLAKIHIPLNKPDLAITEANEVIKADPRAAEAMEVLGLAYMLKGNVAEAEKNLQQAVALKPSLTSAKVQLAALYMNDKRVDAARKLLGEILGTDPKNQKANYLLAAIETTMGNHDKAVDIYRRIAAYHPTDSQALYRAGLLVMEKGELAKAEQIARQLIEKFPSRAEGSRLQGLVYYKKKNYPEAITSLQTSVKQGASLEALYFLGLSFYAKGDLESALSQFRKVLDYSPSFNRARILSAMILLQQRRNDDAIAEATKVVQTDEKNALAHNILGSAYMAKGMYDEGMKELSRATELDPKLIDAHLKKGVFLLGSGKTEQAETELSAAVRVAPDVLNTRLVLASHYLGRGNTAKALAVSREGLTGGKNDAPLYNFMARTMIAANKPAEGARYLEKAKVADPSFLPTYFNLATFHAVSGKYDQALAEYGVVLRMQPENLKALLGSAALLQLKGMDAKAVEMYERAKKTKEPAAYLALANFYMKKNDTGRALATLDEGIKNAPRNAATLEMKGRILLGKRDYRAAIQTFDQLESIAAAKALPLKVSAYLMQKDFGRAEEQARRVIALKPGSAFGHIVMASVYESRGNIPRAIDAVKVGMKADPKDPQAAMVLGGLYMRQKDPVAAMGAYDEALRRLPGYAPAYYAKGSIYELTGKRKEAVASYRAAIEKSANHVPSLNNLSYLYAQGMGSPKEALQLALTAYKLEPGNPAVMDTLGFALLKNGRAKEARTILEKSASLLPKNPSVAYHLALACKESGDRPQAIKVVRNALAMGEFRESAAARALLAELTGGRS